MNWIKQQAGQPSTWRGLAILLSVAGVSQAEGIVAAVSGIVAGGIALYDILRVGRPFGSPGA
jgi:hypothetical protein